LGKYEAWMQTRVLVLSRGVGNNADLGVVWVQIGLGVGISGMSRVNISVDRRDTWEWHQHHLPSQ